MISRSFAGDGSENSIDPSRGSASQPNITSFHLADFKHRATAIRHGTAGEIAAISELEGGFI